MSWIQSTLEEFGKYINIHNLEFNDKGIICLDFKDGKSLFIEQNDNAMFIYLAVDIQNHSHNNLSELLKLTHYKYGRRWLLNVAINEDDTIFLIVKIAPSEFTATNLQDIMEMLFSTYENFISK